MRDPKKASAGTKRSRFSDLLRSKPMSEEDFPNPNSNSSSEASPGYCSDRSPNLLSAEASPYAMSPWAPATSPYVKSPWTLVSPAYPFPNDASTGLLASLVREEGHVYSLAATGDLLYTGSDSKNIRVWKGRKEFSGFKSNSGLVKAIVIAGERIFTGHQDGKIRVWKVSPTNPTVHKRVGSLPKLRDFLRSSINPRNYVKVRRNRKSVWLRHFDAVSCLSLDVEHGLLYSGSWDKTFKVWRLSDSKCLESVDAHDDAINSIMVGFDGHVFTGSADGTVKAWRREMTGRSGGTRHVLVQTLLRQESAVTALAVDRAASMVYSGSSDGLVNIWEWRRGRRPVHGGSLRGHRQAVLCLSAAGNLVLSGSADKTICVWKRESSGAYVRLAVLSGHAGPVKCLAMEADATESGGGGARWVVYSGSLDRSVKVWRLSDQQGPGALLLRSPLHVPMPVGPGAKEPYRASKGTGGAQGVYSPPVGQEVAARGRPEPTRPAA